jgi:hypothetical protein
MVRAETAFTCVDHVALAHQVVYESTKNSISLGHPTLETGKLE